MYVFDYTYMMSLTSSLLINKCTHVLIDSYKLLLNRQTLLRYFYNQNNYFLKTNQETYFIICTNFFLRKHFNYIAIY